MINRNSSICYHGGQGTKVSQPMCRSVSLSLAATSSLNNANVNRTLGPF